MTAAPPPKGFYPIPSGLRRRSRRRLGHSCRSRRMTRSTPIRRANRSKSGRRARCSRTRNIPYHILGLPTPLKTTQLLYRSTSQTGKADRQRHVDHPAAAPAGYDANTVVSIRLRLAEPQRSAVARDQRRPDIRRPRAQCGTRRVRNLSRAGLHGDRAGHRRSAGRLRRGPGVREEHPRLDPRCVQCVGGRDRERRERRVCSATPEVRSPASGPPN